MSEINTENKWSLFGILGKLLFLLLALTAGYQFVQSGVQKPTDVKIPPNSSNPSNSTIEITATPSQPSLLIGSTNTFTVMFKITVPEEFTERPPIELCIVLDISGSMGGSKLENSKNAIRSILQTIRPGDIVHLIVYADDARIIFSNETSSRKESLDAQVAKLVTEGATNMYSGILLAQKLISESKHTGKIKRIFLFSDGHVNVGEINHNIISERVNYMHEKEEITTTSFGIGDDFDEKLMTELAKSGRGTFFFIDRPERIPNIVSMSTQKLIKTVALDAIFQFTPKTGFVVKRAFGFEDSKILKLGDLNSGETRKILIEVESNGEAKSPSVEVLEYKLKYKDVQTKDKQKISGKVVMETTVDTEKVKERDPEVSKFEKVQRIEDQDLETHRLIKEGNFGEALNFAQNVVLQLNSVPESERDEYWKSQLLRDEQIVDDMKYGNNYQRANKRLHMYHADRAPRDVV